MLAVAMALGLPLSSAQARTPGPANVKTDSAPSSWIVVFDEPAAATFRGFDADSRRPKLAATSPVATGKAKYDSRSAAARAYVDYLAELRETRLADIGARLGRDIRPQYVYAHATNGVALKLTPAEAALVADVPGVRQVSPEFQRFIQTDDSPGWVGAEQVWNGLVPGVGQHRGEGVVVGVIDTGLFRAHNAFTGSGITNPRGQYYGYCSVNATACNSKVIGLWDFIGASNGLADPVDDQGHGTHVAATAAGNPFLAFSGVAPRANIIAYKACADDSCNGTALIASIDRAVGDGVDVINYSIGSSPHDPFLGIPFSTYYDDAEAFLAAREAGIVVAAAAGNDGPGDGTHSSPANSPWVFGVANARHDNDGPTAAYDDDIYSLNGSSGRGPVVPFGVIKPDVTGPGTNIVSAGLGAPSALATKTGTSMATPHVAGAAALVLSSNPALTADQVFSALTLTARNVVRRAANIAADPHEQGAGMIDVARAVRAGLYLEVPANAFRAANADPFDGAAEQLNLPSLGDGACFLSCTMTRTLKLMPGASAANYTVTASMITAGATISATPGTLAGSAGGAPLSVTVDVSNPALLNRWAYGWVTLTNTSGDGRPNLRLPVAVYSTPFADGATEAALSGTNHTATHERGYFDVAVGGMVALPSATFATTALVQPTRTVQTIAPDTTRDDPYDSPVGTYTQFIDIPATTVATAYRIGASTRAASGDIDLYVGHDDDGDGIADADEQLCVSGTATASEQCVLDGAHTTATRYWVLVQNWSGTTSPVTVDSYALPLIATEAPGLTVTGPGNVPGGAPFDIRVAYDDPTMLDTQKRIGALLIQRSPGDTVVTAPFEITRAGNTPSPFGLAPGAARRVSLPAGGAHERLYVDIPPGTTQATFRTQNGTGSVTLYAARVDLAAGPVVAAAPARGSASHSASAAGANQSIVVANPAAGRWYLTPVNTGGDVATVDVVASIDGVSASVPALKRGSYFNPTRGGHGVFIYPSGAEHALLWYTYLQDGTPTWYYAQAPLPGTSQVWNSPVYRAAWNGTTRTLEPIGNLVLTPRGDGQLSMTYNIDGFTGAETLDTFLTGCPTHSGAPLDVSAHWFDEASPGYGYSVQVAANYEFLATFVYDGIGVPRFLSAEREGAFQSGTPTVPVYQLAGFAPLGAYATPTYTTVGELTRAYGVGTIQTIGANATFVDGVPGSWSREGTVTRLSSQTQGCD